MLRRKAKQVKKVWLRERLRGTRALSPTTQAEFDGDKRKKYIFIAQSHQGLGGYYGSWRGLLDTYGCPALSGILKIALVRLKMLPWSCLLLFPTPELDCERL